MGYYDAITKYSKMSSNFRGIDKGVRIYIIECTEAFVCFANDDDAKSMRSITVTYNGDMSETVFFDDQGPLLPPLLPLHELFSVFGSRFPMINCYVELDFKEDVDRENIYIMINEDDEPRNAKSLLYHRDYLSNRPDDMIHFELIYGRMKGETGFFIRRAYETRHIIEDDSK